MSERRAIAAVYHLVDERNWASVQRHGLQSARRLIEACGGDYAAGAPWRRQRRDDVVLSDGNVIRHQRPMPPAALARALRDGLTPADWYELLNSHVFFWLDPQRLERQRRACGSGGQIVLTIDASRLLAKYGGAAFVSPFNVGNAMRAAAPRSRRTFVPYERWRTTAWESERGAGLRERPRAHRPAELILSDAVPDIMSYVSGIAPLGSREGAGSTAR